MRVTQLHISCEYWQPGKNLIISVLLKTKAQSMVVKVTAKTVPAELDSFAFTSDFKLLLKLVCKHHRLYRKALVLEILLVKFSSCSKYVQKVNEL